jgi:hypothetical protein
MEKERTRRYSVFLNLVTLESDENLMTMREMIDTELTLRKQQRETTEALGNLYVQMVKNGSSPRFEKGLKETWKIKPL